MVAAEPHNQFFQMGQRSVREWPESSHDMFDMFILDIQRKLREAAKVSQQEIGLLYITLW